MSNFTMMMREEIVSVFRHYRALLSGSNSTVRSDTPIYDQLEREWAKTWWVQ